MLSYLQMLCSFDFYNALDSETSPVGGPYQFIVKNQKPVNVLKTRRLQLLRANRTSQPVSEPCLNVHFYGQHLLLPVEWM